MNDGEISLRYNVFLPINEIFSNISKVGCVFPMVVVSILPHAEFEPNDHQKDTPDFSKERFEAPLLIKEFANNFKVNEILIIGKSYFSNHG